MKLNEMVQEDAPLFEYGLFRYGCPNCGGQEVILNPIDAWKQSFPDRWVNGPAKYATVGKEYPFEALIEGGICACCQQRIPATLLPDTVGIGSDTLDATVFFIDQSSCPADVDWKRSDDPHNIFGCNECDSRSVDADVTMPGYQPLRAPVPPAPMPPTAPPRTYIHRAVCNDCRKPFVEGELPFQIIIRGRVDWPIDVQLGRPVDTSPYGRLDGFACYRHGLEQISNLEAEGRHSEIRRTALRLRWVLQRIAADLVETGYGQKDQEMWDQADQLTELVKFISKEFIQ